ncbi:response regulator [Desulfococcaceae bacterium HSG7]|nr:response regulator [Desulfococcaceae bacterium HSG7]
MRNILMVDDEKAFLQAGKEMLELIDKELRVSTAYNGKDALEILASSSIDLVVSDLRMPVMDGYELIARMSRRHQEIPVIVLTAYGSAEIKDRLIQQGTVYLEKPIDFRILLNEITKILKNKVRNTIHGFSLVSFLQLFEIEQKTKTLKVTSKNKLGYLYIKKGAIIDAAALNLQGEDAAIEIIGWDNTEIELLPQVHKEKRITSSLMHTLLKATQTKDESMPSENYLLDNAIHLVQGCHFKKARSILIQLLKDSPRNAKAWLWYSRIAGNMKTIEASLTNARKLAPEDIEIIDEIKKFNAISLIINSKKQTNAQAKKSVRRCPFCWTPAEINARQCHYCKAHFFINKQIFSQRNSAPESDQIIIFKNAIKRYSEVISCEKNITANYYLGLAHLNLAQWEKAITFLHQTVKLAPKKKQFAEQLRFVLNHIASIRPASEAAPDTNHSSQKAYLGPDRKKILVVEDSSTTRKVIAITLSQNDYHVIEACDGIEALSRLNEHKPDLIILDIILPKMDGFKILSIIKSNSDFKETPVIMLTSKDSFFSKVKGRMAGSTAYLTKPFDPQKLIETIKKNLQ